MREVYVIGAGMHPFGRYPDKELPDLAGPAVQAALADAGLTWRQVQMTYCGHVRGGTTAAQTALAPLGYTGAPVINCENACAAGSTAFYLAALAVGAGQCDVALVLGMEKMTRGMVPTAAGGDMARLMGLNPLPGKYAMIARRYMHDHGCSAADFAMVSVKSHGNGVHNPYAQYRHACTVEEVLASRQVCDPLTLLQCCPTSDGAAAVVLAARRPALASPQRPLVRVRATVLVSQFHVPGDPFDVSEMTARAAQQAYATASCGPEDLDAVELHDCFTSAEVIHVESLGLCAHGEGTRLAATGRNGRGGRVAVSPSGGLLSRGHPLGATGVAQVAELVWQLRGQAGGRQVEGARLGLTHTVGGGGGGACAVHILERAGSARGR